ncbi:MAG: hypothetical protein OEY14_10110 [Myxococcales bacterium]|nr:hypothetical protein [Myxococcales bacterium]
MRARILGTALTLGLGMLSIGCGAAAVPPVQRPPTMPPPVRYAGIVRYEARLPSARGVSAAIETRPARWVRLRALDAGGEPLGLGRTDGEGRFAFEAPPGVTLEIAASVDHEGHRFEACADAGGERVHLHLEALPAGAPPNALEIVVPDEGEGVAGAFHIVDTFLRGSLAVREWTGRALPALFAYWGRGVTTDWSYYRAERVPGSGRYGIELLGGEPNQRATSDTDEHDEAIILHEMGHFVMDMLSTDSSTGGSHPGHALVEPGLAWEEGRASFFAAAVLARSVYEDTIGVEPTGSLRVNEDFEEAPEGLVGLGSERSVSAVLWDLADGAGGLEDRDADPLALGPAAVLEAMIAEREEPGAYPALSTFLGFLLRTGRAPRDRLKELLRLNRQPQSLLPAGAAEDWPRTLAIGGRVRGRIDGRSERTPSGSPPLPATGFDAVHVYRVEVRERGRLDIGLRIEGSGRVAEREDLDLELRTLRAAPILEARSELPFERVVHLAEPGWYVIYVRDGGAGNRARYELDVTLRPPPPTAPETPALGAP